MKNNEFRKLIKECIVEVLKEYSAGSGYSSVPAQGGVGHGDLSPMMEGDYCNLLKGKDYSTVSGLSYHLKEEGCDTKLSYKDGNHRLLVRRDHMPKVFETLSTSSDEVELTLAERLKSTHFKNK